MPYDSLMPVPMETLWRLRWRWRSRMHCRAPRLPAALVYHRVCETDLDPLLLGVSPENFGAQMRVLSEHCEPFAAEEYAAGAVEGTLPERAVCVTFDDGYADNLHIAQPILATHGVPGCVFVATGLVSDGRETWWDAVERALLQAPSGNVSLELGEAGDELEVACPDDDAESLRGWNVVDEDETTRQGMYRELMGWLHGRPPAEIDRHIGKLNAWAGVSPEPRPERRLMTIEEVKVAAEAPLLSLGGHTSSHPVLSSLPPAEQAREIGEGLRTLAGWMGREPEVFAYPFGTYGEYNRATRAMAARSGVAHAFANMPAAAQHAHPFEIPRSLVRDWDGDEFRRRLGI